MNLRTPQDIINELGLERRSLINKVIAKISQSLEQSFKGVPIEIHIDQPASVLRPIAKVIQIKLANKGWKIEFGEERSSYQDTYTIAAVGSLKPMITNDRRDGYDNSSDENYEQQWER